MLKPAACRVLRGSFSSSEALSPAGEAGSCTHHPALPQNHAVLGGDFLPAPHAGPPRRPRGSAGLGRGGQGEAEAGLLPRLALPPPAFCNRKWLWPKLRVFGSLGLISAIPLQPGGERTAGEAAPLCPALRCTARRCPAAGPPHGRGGSRVCGRQLRGEAAPAGALCAAGRRPAAAPQFAGCPGFRGGGGWGSPRLVPPRRGRAGPAGRQAAAGTPLGAGLSRRSPPALSARGLAETGAAGILPRRGGRFARQGGRCRPGGEGPRPPLTARGGRGRQRAAGEGQA